MTQKADTPCLPSQTPKEKPLSCYNAGGKRKLNSRRLKCSLESLSIPLSSTHTHPRSPNLPVTVYSSITVNCSLGNLAGLHILPIFPHSSPLLRSLSTKLSPSLSITSCLYIRVQQTVAIAIVGLLNAKSLQNRRDS